MKNLNVQEKSEGVVLFAFNTDAVDYVSIADQSARLIKHTLNLPVTLITDTGCLTEHFEQTIVVKNTFKNHRIGHAHGTQWRNGNRYSAYELSPYDTTLLLDIDYLQLDTNLLKLVDTVTDYVIMKDNRSPIASMNGNMGVLNMPYVWATAIAFNKTAKSRILFDLVRRIQENYSYYQKLYQIRERNFRNDYAFAIADMIVNGYTPSPGTPWTMLTIDKPITNIEVQGNMLVIREAEQAYILPKQNIHVMDKEYLISDKFKRLVDELCQK